MSATKTRAPGGGTATATPTTEARRELVDQIRRKSGFLCAVLDSNVELTDDGDRGELLQIATDIFTAAESLQAMVSRAEGLPPRKGRT